jgi:hypothetical protein
MPAMIDHKQKNSKKGKPGKSNDFDKKVAALKKAGLLNGINLTLNLINFQVMSLYRTSTKKTGSAWLTASCPTRHLLLNKKASYLLSPLNASKLYCSLFKL